MKWWVFSSAKEAEAGNRKESLLVKKYILVAGVNGAGKSTLYQSLQSLHGIPRVNTDEILREFGDWRNMTDIMTAGKMAVRKIARCFDEGITFNQETTLCGKSILSNIAKAKKRGYFIELHYIGVENADIAKERVARRIKQGGHGIAEQDIERRFVETFDNLKKVLPESNLAVFYDNTIEFRRFAIEYCKRAIDPENTMFSGFSYILNFLSDITKTHKIFAVTNT